MCPKRKLCKHELHKILMILDEFNQGPEPRTSQIKTSRRFLSVLLCLYILQAPNKIPTDLSLPESALLQLPKKKKKEKEKGLGI